ncbi:MAG: phosphatidylserine/phosphatidylglycerophosphate/cardiolipin synthase family protein [Bacteriovoracia bacterium]
MFRSTSILAKFATSVHLYVSASVLGLLFAASAQAGGGARIKEATLTFQVKDRAFASYTNFYDEDITTLEFLLEYRYRSIFNGQALPFDSTPISSKHKLPYFKTDPKADDSYVLDAVRILVPAQPFLNPTREAKVYELSPDDFLQLTRSVRVGAEDKLILALTRLGDERRPMAYFQAKQGKQRFFAQESDVVAEAPFHVTSNEPHQIQILEHSAHALAARLRLLESAEQSIELETYIMDRSRSARLIYQILARKARAGVKVRLLQDRGPHNSDYIDSYLSLALQEAGVEFKVYNPFAGMDPHQIRNHRKLIAVDGRRAIIGGRNVEDRYYYAGADFNFADRDIWIEGPIVAGMVESFDRFWRDEASRTWDVAREPSRWDYENGGYHADLKQFMRRREEARQLLTEDTFDFMKRMSLGSVAPKQDEEAPLFTVNKLTFVSDRPGNRYRGRVVSHYMFARMQAAQREILVENPYFIPMDDARTLYKEILAKRPALNFVVLTNSRYSASRGQLLVAKIMEDESAGLVKKGLKMFGYAGHLNEPNTWGGGVAEQKRAELHGKSMVIDGRDVMIGSVNLDPRSLNYNSELALFVDDAPEFAAEVKRLTEQRIAESYEIMPNGMPKVEGIEPLDHSGGAHFGSNLGFFFTLLLHELF